LLDDVKPGILAGSCYGVLAMFARGKLQIFSHIAILIEFGVESLEGKSLFLWAMKFISVILAFLVLTLSCLPCVDDVFATNTGKASIESLSQNNQEEDQEHNDACSPFCHCTCCASFSINQTSLAISEILIYSGKSYLSYLPPNIIEVSLPIWQPPQLV